MKKDYKKMFDILEEYLDKKDFDVDKTVLKAVEDRKNGKNFSFNEHIKGLVFSLLSSQRDWSEIHKNRQYIEKLFFNFDKQKIKNTDYHDFIKGLVSHSLGNRAIHKQMETLNYNILILEKIEKEYDSLDDFVTRLKPNAISALLACKESPYALKQIGFPLALEYLRNVGIDTVKPDVHIVRIFKRLGLLKGCESEEKEVLEVIEILSAESGYSKAYIDFLLWHYCSVGFGNICSENNPKCEQCVISEFCAKKTKSINNKQVVKKTFVIKKTTEIIKNDNITNNFYKMSQSAIRDYSEHIATEKLYKLGYKFININSGKERSLFRITNNNKNTLVRFMFYRFNPNVTNNYAWILKKNFNDSEYGYLVFVLYVVNSVHVLFIPASDIIRPSNDAMILNIFESRDYEGKKSAPEWGINLNYGIINFLIAHYEAK